MYLASLIAWFARICGLAVLVQLSASAPTFSQSGYDEYIDQCSASTGSPRDTCEKQLTVSCGVLAITSKGGVADSYAGICAQRPDATECGDGQTLIALDKPTCMDNDFIANLCGGAREDYDGTVGPTFYETICVPAVAATPQEAPTATADQSPVAAPPENTATETAASPSFDCARARLAAERAICANARVAALDRKMASLYYAHRRRLSGTARVRLASQQRKWLGRRNSCNRKISCLIGMYEQRIRELE